MTSDWHPEDIKAAVRKRGLTLASLARQLGMSTAAFTHALRVPRAAPEQAIASFLEIDPSVIWPSRYNKDGSRKAPQPVDNYLAVHRVGNAPVAAVCQGDAR